MSLEALLANVDRLNSWVRSDSFALGSAGRYVIYHFKNQAIAEAKNAGLVDAVRAVYSVVTCRDCGGSKRYTDSWGYTHDHCRRCSSTGTTRLRFAETTIGGYRWHTPRERTFSSSFPVVDWDKEEEARDWAPNEKDGRDLELDVALTALMELEASHLPRPRPYIAYDGESWDYFATYRVHVGGGDEATCCVCLSPADRPGWWGASLARVEWTAKVCKACQLLYSGGAIFERLKQIGPPRHLITPVVQAWIETHPAPPRRSSPFTY